MRVAVGAVGVRAVRTMPTVRSHSCRRGAERTSIEGRLYDGIIRAEGEKITRLDERR